MPCINTFFYIPGQNASTLDGLLSRLLMVQCSKHVIPPAIKADLTNRPAHDLGIGLNVQLQTVLTGQRLGTILSAHANRTIDSH